MIYGLRNVNKKMPNNRLSIRKGEEEMKNNNNIRNIDADSNTLHRLHV